MPSSSEAVATTALRSPDFRSSSVGATAVEAQAAVVGVDGFGEFEIGGFVVGEVIGLVEPGGEPFGDAAVVGEDDGGAMVGDQLLAGVASMAGQIERGGALATGRAGRLPGRALCVGRRRGW